MPPAASAAASRNPLRRWLGALGPGLITGAADDDPSGIATYTQGGAQFGYAVLWTVVLTTPLMIAVQYISARIALVTGRGLAANMRDALPLPVTLAIVALLLVANTLNIAADLAAMGQVAELQFGGRAHLYIVGFAALSLYLQIRLPYQRTVRVLKWLTLALLTYVGIVFTVQLDWPAVLAGALLPRVSFSADYLTVVVAILGTTISPYLFFWQAAQEVEDGIARRAHAEAIAPHRPDDQHPGPATRRELRRVKIDTTIGMVFSNLIAFFVMLTGAVALHANGLTEVSTTREAAAALRPIVGEFATLMFALGIVGTGLLAVPVLAGSAAYAVAEAARQPTGLDEHPQTAPAFYAILTVAMVMGVAMDFLPFDPVRMLFWAALVNGVITVPVLAAMITLATRRSVMGQFTIRRRLQVAAWMTFGVMAAAVTAMLWLWVAG